MADADTSQSNNSEKAEKLAAARKRFEELKRKKQPNKKASGVTPQKEVTPNDSVVLEGSSHEVAAAEIGAGDQGKEEIVNIGPSQESEADGHVMKEEDAARQLDGGYSENGLSESHGTNSDVLLETLPEIYRKQASVIDDLRADKQHLLDEIKVLHLKAQEGSKAMVERDKALEDLASVSEELQVVKEKNGMEQATLLEGAGEASSLKAEVASLNRQIAHLQSQIAQRDKAIVEIRRDSSISSPGPDEVMKQEERIESMSVELSEFKAALEASVSSANYLKLERDRLEALVGSMKVELEIAAKTADGLENKLARLTESINSDNAKNSIWEEKTRTQEQIITELNQRLTGMKSTVDQLKQSNQELRASERDAESRYRDVEKRLNNAQRENSSMQLRLAQLKSSLHQTSAQAANAETSEMPHRGTGHGSNEVNPHQLQENIGGEESSSDDHLWKQVLADESSHDFLDVDLRAVARNPMQSQSVPEQSRVSSQKDQERRFLTQRVRKELERWRGHRINLIDVYRAYDDSYSRIFDI